MKIGINREGWYRISQAELVAAGLDENVNAPQLQLYTNGRAVPIRQSGDGVHLTSSDYIEFYGGAAESPTDEHQMYYLVVNAEAFGSRIHGVDLSQSGTAAGAFGTKRVRLHGGTQGTDDLLLESPQRRDGELLRPDSYVDSGFCKYRS